MGLFDVLRARIDPEIVDGYASDFRATAAVRSALRPITASGERINLKSEEQLSILRYRTYSEWQADAWAYFDAIGEIKYGFGMLAAVMSRMVLYAGLDLDPDTIPTSTLNYRRRQEGLSESEKILDAEREMNPPEALTTEVMQYAERLLRDLRSGPGGISGLLRSFTLNMCVPGECYLIKIKNRWMIKSTSEVVVDVGGQVLLRQQRTMMGTTYASSNGTILGDIALPSNTFMARIWREHPRYSREPDSSMLALREPCDELVTLQRMIRAVARSNMNAGILYIPEGLRVAEGSVDEDVANAEEEDEELIKTIYDNIRAPVIDESAGSTIVPTILTGPVDLGKGIAYIELGRKVDQFLTERADKSLIRILQGIDLPKDFVTGMANVRFTNSKEISEQLYRSHIEPLALVLCDALTQIYLRPFLNSKFPKLTSDDLDKICVWYDPSQVVTKSDPSEAADKGYDKFAVSSDAWRAAHGFSDTDAPSELEIAMRILEKSALPPELITSLFNSIFVSVVERQRGQNIEKKNMPQSARDLLYGMKSSDVAAAPPTNGSSGNGSSGRTPGPPSTTGPKPAREGPQPSPTGMREGDPSEIVVGSAAPVLASASRKTLYTIPYNGNTMQSRYRVIAEAAVRGGDSVEKLFRTATLTPTQPADQSSSSGSGAGAKDLPPIVIHHEGVDYMLDGHHRAMNRHTIRAAYVDVDDLRTDLLPVDGRHDSFEV